MSPSPLLINIAAASHPRFHRPIARPELFLLGKAKAGAKGENNLRFLPPPFACLRFLDVCLFVRQINQSFASDLRLLFYLELGRDLVA